MKKAIPKKLAKDLTRAFEPTSNRGTIKVKASKLENAVHNIAVRKVLSKALKKRKESVGNFLACVRKVIDLKISIDNFGNCCHMASSEPYFYDQSYANGKTPIPVDEQGMHVIERDIWDREPRATPIPVDEQGRCVLAQEMGERDPKTQQPSRWKCTSECKLPTADEKQRVVDCASLSISYSSACNPATFWFSLTLYLFLVPALFARAHPKRVEVTPSSLPLVNVTYMFRECFQAFHKFLLRLGLHQNGGEICVRFGNKGGLKQSHAALWFPPLHLQLSSHKAGKLALYLSHICFEAVFIF